MRNTYRRSFVEKVLKTIWKIRSKTSDMKSVFNKVGDLIVYDFIRKKLRERYFPVSFPKFLKRPIL